MNFEILPLIGIGELKFGMDRGQVRRYLGERYRSFKRSPQSMSPCDYFEHLGVFCYYDSSDELEAVELALPACPSIDNRQLLGLGIATATRTLGSLSQNIQEEADGTTARDIGVSVHAPLAKENTAAPVESVLVFRSGYYD